MNTNNNYDVQLSNIDVTDNINKEELPETDPSQISVTEDNNSGVSSGTENNVASDELQALAKIANEDITERWLNRTQWLQIYLVSVIFCNLYLLFFDGHFDLGFWKNWTTQLATTGFVDYHGDYPPLWSDWLYLVSRFYLYFQMPIENNILFKYVTQIPITVYHLVLTYLIYKIVNAHAKNELHFHGALILTVFNPAILFNGPIWGQIDITPLIPLIAALMAGVSKRYQVFTIPLYAIAMLTKFQMIAFAPLFGILFFRSYKNHLVGILLCVPTFLIAFLPAIFANNFVQAFTLPYVGSLSMFSASTMGAANIWILITGNLAADSIVLFGIDPNSGWARLFTVRHVGMIGFSIICLFVFVSGMKKLALNKFEQNQPILTSDIFFYAVVCSTAFFTVLPGMHERYLLPAAIVALAYYASSPTKAIYPVTLTLISALNLTMSHGIKTSSIWPSLSWIMLAVFVYLIFEFLLGERWVKVVKCVIAKMTLIPLLSVWVLLISIVSTTYILYQKNNIHQAALLSNQILLTQFSPSYAMQDYGTLQTNLSVAGNPLRLGGKRYANGLGTHANSTVNFTIPTEATNFSFMAGLDSSVESADVKFSVWGNGKLLWESPLIYRSEKNAKTINISLNNIQELSLQVSAMGNISSDHANWINPVLTLPK